jgi:signal peptide peptidase SppA
VIPLTGVLTPRYSFLSYLFGGGGGLVDFRDAFREALNSPDVGAIVLDVDSPGGLIDLVPETAAEIRDARGTKPIVAVANTMAASGAYWIAAQADELVVTPSGSVGSIGVYMVHEDWSGFNEQQGIQPTYISAGKYKTEGNPDEPLSDEARADWQQEVDDLYAMFVADVAAGRGVTAEQVRDGYGEGRTLLADRALAAGMVDRVDTIETVIGALLVPGSTGGAAARAGRASDRAAAAPRPPRLPPATRPIPRPRPNPTPEETPPADPPSPRPVADRTRRRTSPRRPTPSRTPSRRRRRAPRSPSSSSSRTASRRAHRARGLPLRPPLVGAAKPRRHTGRCVNPTVIPRRRPACMPPASTPTRSSSPGCSSRAGARSPSDRALGRPDLPARRGRAEGQAAQGRGQLAAARDERVALVKARDEARAAFAGSESLSQDSDEFKAAQAAVAALGECDDRIAELQAIQVGTLKMLGKDAPEPAGGRGRAATRPPRGAPRGTAARCSPTTTSAPGCCRRPRPRRGSAASTSARSPPATRWSPTSPAPRACAAATTAAIVPQLRRRLSVLDLIPTGTMDNNTFPYTKESGSFGTAARPRRASRSPRRR